MKTMVKVLLVSVILLLAGTTAQSKQADLITNVRAHDHVYRGQPMTLDTIISGCPMSRVEPIGFMN